MNPAPQNIDQLRSKLHEYIEQADERHLNAIYVLVESDVGADLVYDAATLAELYKRRDAHLQGISRSYSVEESLALVRSNRK